MNGAETTQQLWSTDEFGGRWTLGPEDLALLAGLPDAGKLGLAAQLAYWRRHGRFPDDEADLAPAVIGHLAVQVGVGADALDGYDWTGRTGRRHRRLVRDHLAVVTFDDAAEVGFRRWLAGELLPSTPSATPGSPAAGSKASGADHRWPNRAASRSLG